MTIDDRDSRSVQNKIRSIKAVDVIIYRQSVSRSRDGKIPALFVRKMGISHSPGESEVKRQNISITDPVVSDGLTLAMGRLNKTSSAIERNLTDNKQADCPALTSHIEPVSFAILQQIGNSTGYSVKLT